MADTVIEFPAVEDNAQFQETWANLMQSLPKIEGGDLTAIFDMPEDQFMIVAPILLNELERGLNNPNDRLLFVHAFSMQGLKAEDLKEAFEEFNELIETQLTTVSQQKRDFIKRMFGILLNAVTESEGIAKRYIRIPIELCQPGAKMPEYAHIGDAAMDVFACEDVTIDCGETKIVDLGFKMELPLGYAMLVHPRSGLSAKTKMRVANSPGLCDSGYRGSYGVVIENCDNRIKDIKSHYDDEGKLVIDAIDYGSPIYITKGMKIAQIRLVEVPTAVLYEVEDVNETERGEGGFGSTGVE